MSGVRGIPALDRAAVAAATLALQDAALGRGWVLSMRPGDAEEIARAALRAYMAGRRLKMERIVPAATRQMAAMDVGDVIELDDESIGRDGWRSRVKAARRYAMNPDARWLVRCLPHEGGVRIKRVADGSSEGMTKPVGSRAAVLVEMQPGEVAFVLWRKVEHQDRITARRILGRPDAMWRARATSKGLRLERVR